jgi:glycosyltransferase involved in cell wall biosynthesis
MKLLILTPQLPYPPQQGTTIRNFNLIKQLAPRHEITLLSFGTKDELREAEPLRALCHKIVIAPYPSRSGFQRAKTTLFSPLPDMALRLASTEMRAKFAAIVQDERFDIIQVEGIEMAEVWKSEFSNGELGKNAGNINHANSYLQAPISVFDDHNAEYVLQHTAYESDARHPARWLAALYSFIQWNKLQVYERDICRRADHTIVCSEADAIAIRTLTFHQSRVTVIPNGVDIEHYVPSNQVCAKPLSELAMVYTGKMDFRPNIDAMLWFCKDILPRIRGEIPLAHLVVAGQKPVGNILALQKKGQVEITGWVSDVRPYIADAAIYVVPLRIGGGTRLKVLEAMAMGKAMVSTTRGVEGIELTDGRNVMVADSPEKFARICVALMRDPSRRAELGRNARELAEDKHDWRRIIPAFDRIYEHSISDKSIA